ncbi:GrpB family protein [Bacillus sp. FSL K6-3431]|uniref:GrpB family protein n=1 Tax=Bacillus sp. FSL K6-3431 TaxID=2921500 RepID=UPI004046F8C3
MQLLRAHAKNRKGKRYGELKVRLAKQFPDNTHEYQIAKGPFVNNLVEKVKHWASKRTFF